MKYIKQYNKLFEGYDIPTNLVDDLLVDLKDNGFYIETFDNTPDDNPHFAVMICLLNFRENSEREIENGNITYFAKRDELFSWDQVLEPIQNMIRYLSEEYDYMNCAGYAPYDQYYKSKDIQIGEFRKKYTGSFVSIEGFKKMMNYYKGDRKMFEKIYIKFAFRK